MHTSDILIIGAGIVGVSTAWRLAELGHRVTVLERGEVASEASGVNAGMLGGYGWGNEATRTQDLETQLYMGSLAVFQDLQLSFGYDIELRLCGLMQAIMTQAQHDLAVELVAEAANRGQDLTLLSPTEARSREPGLSSDILGALHAPQCGQADPLKSAQAMADLAQRAGADLRLHHRVTNLAQTPGHGWQVETDRGAFSAKVLALAAGAWCRPLGRLIDLEIPIFPVRGQMWATDPQPPRVHHLIASAESELHWHDPNHHTSATPPFLTHDSDGTRATRHLYGRQTYSGEIIFGGDRLLTDQKIVDMAGIAVNRTQAAQILPFLADLPIRRTWSGIMPFPLDGKPLIGAVPSYDNLYIGGGLRSSGFGRGPMTGRLLAECIHTGKAMPILADADPARLIRRLSG